jgi:hypothetical protein
MIDPSPELPDDTLIESVEWDGPAELQPRQQ